MEYKFPHITHIGDVLPAIAGRDEFVVADKGAYTIINYNVMMADTFPPIETEFNSVSGSIDPMIAAMRRECRGIIFNTKTGEIIRRPLHKFMNIGEREETLLHNLNFNNEHYVDVKLDGSMAAAFIDPELHRVVFGTKMCAPDFAQLIADFVADDSRSDYYVFTHSLIKDGYTPIFEYVSRKKRIVLDYPEDDLILLAVRNMVTGEYTHKYGTFAEECGIPVVGSFSSIDDPHSFISYVRALKGQEGFVIRWADGHRVKAKSDEYVQIHKAKERILQDRNIVELILDEKLDDVKAHLPSEDRERLTKFESDFNHAIKSVVAGIYIDVQFFKSSRFGGDRKEFAIAYAPNFNSYVKPIMFSMWDKEGTREEVEDAVRNTVRNNLTKTVKYEAIRDVWFPGVKFND